MSFHWSLSAKADIFEKSVCVSSSSLFFVLCISIIFFVLCISIIFCVQ